MARAPSDTGVFREETLHPAELFSRLKKGFRAISDESPEPLERAFALGKEVHAKQTRESGAPYITHPLIVALLLLPYRPDRETLVAAILHDAFEDSEDKRIREIVRTEFGKGVADLIEGVSKIGDIPAEAGLRRNEETIRKMFRSAGKDARTILIKLADRLHNVLTLGGKKDPEKRRLKAQETLDIFVPVAARLGVWELKRQLEDHCYPHLYPEEHAKLLKTLSRRRARAERLYRSIEATVEKSFPRKELIEVREHRHGLFSFRRRGLTEPTPEETFAIQLIVPNEDACYRALSRLGKLYASRAEELRDYVTSPKDNGYRALHATMVVDGTHTVRFHVLTREMAERNRDGVVLDIARGERKTPFLRGISAIDRATATESDRYIRAIQSDVLDEKILLHHGKGQKTYVPRHATALDAAFLVFGEKALRADKILLSGKTAEPWQSPQNNDVLTVRFTARPAATVDWMRHLRTVDGRLKLQAHLKQHDRVSKITLGQRLLQAEFDRYGKGDVFRHLAQNPAALKRVRVRAPEELFTLIAEGLVLPSAVLDDLDIGRDPARAGILGRLQRPVLPRAPGSTLDLQIWTQEAGDGSLQSTLEALCREYDVTQERLTVVRQADGSSLARLLIRSPDKRNIDDFFLALQDRHEVTKVSARPSRWLMVRLGVNLAFAGTMWLLFVLLLQTVLAGGDRSGLAYLSIAPVLVGNLVAYRFVSDYFPLLRRNRWFALLAFGANALAVSLYGATLLTSQLDWLQLSIFFPLTILVLSGFALAYTIVRPQVASRPMESRIRHTGLTARMRRDKLTGYAIRLAAVAIWGIEPLYIKHTLANTIDPSVRVFLKAGGGMLVSIIVGLLLAGVARRPLKWKLPYNATFALIIVGEILFTYLINASLLYTSSTNVILLNNFAPVIALIIAAVLWRDTIPYLRDNRHVLAIFGTFIVGSLGSTLLFYNDIKFATDTHLYGDLLGTLTMLVDVVLVIAMIHYVKSLPHNRSVELNFNIFACSLLVMAPFAFLGANNVWTLTPLQLLFGVGAGLLSGVGRILNFEAFRRIDGFLAFLMFNISIFLTFSMEAFLLQKIVPTAILVVGGLMIMSSSILAEFINSRCERRKA